MSDAPPRLFDPRRRALRCDRYWHGRTAAPDFHVRSTEDLLDRIDSVTRPIATALVANPRDPALVEALRARGVEVVEAQVGPATAHRRGAVCAREDQPGLPAGPFDLVVSAAGLDVVDDLPGALSLLRRALRPDGLLLATFPGAGSFAAAREACLAADLSAPGGGATARFHPLVDVRALGDLAARAGLVLPVAEVDGVALAYRSIGRVFADLRAHGWSRALVGPVNPVSRAWLARAEEAFTARADADGRVAERLNLLTLTAWSPGPDQPKPAARGSGSASLATALRPRGPADPTSTGS